MLVGSSASVKPEMLLDWGLWSGELETMLKPLTTNEG